MSERETWTLASSWWNCGSCLVAYLFYGPCCKCVVWWDLCCLLSSCDWEKLLTSVQCAIISEKSNSSMKAYVLRSQVYRCLLTVARLGKIAPIGLLLAAVDALKFGFVALLATLLATFWITGNHWATYKKVKIWYFFHQCLAPWLPEIWQPCVWCRMSQLKLSKHQTRKYVHQCRRDLCDPKQNPDLWPFKLKMAHQLQLPYGTFQWFWFFCTFFRVMSSFKTDRNEWTDIAVY